MLVRVSDGVATVYRSHNISASSLSNRVYGCTSHSARGVGRFVIR